MRIILKGQPITKKNHQQIMLNKTTGKRFVMQSGAYKLYEEDCLWQLKKYSNLKIDYKIQLTCLYYLANARAPDLLNLLAATADILEKAGVITNDKNIVSFDGSRIVGTDENNPRVEIKIE